MSDSLPTRSSGDPQHVIAPAIAEYLVKKGTPSHVAALQSIEAAVAVRRALDDAGYRIVTPGAIGHG